MKDSAHYKRKEHNIWRCLCVLAISVLLASGLQFLIPSPSIGQTPNFLDSILQTGSGEFTQRTNIRINRIGDVEFASVRLDGIPLLQIATAISQPSQNESDLKPIEERVIRIETILQQIISTEFDLDKLEVFQGNLNNQTVLLAMSEPNLPRRVVVTVTALDADLAGESIPSLADSWIEIVRSGLISAKLERQSENLVEQSQKAAAIAIAAILMSTGIFLVQRKTMKHWQKLKQSQEEENREENSDYPQVGFDGRDTSLEWAMLASYAIPRLQSLKLGRFNSTILSLLRFAQLLVFVGSVTWITHLFPYSRGFGNWLLGLPLRFLIFIVLVLTARRIIFYSIDIVIQTWIDNKSIEGSGAPRQSKRAPTITLASKHMVNVIAYLVVGAVVLIELLDLSTLSVLTSAGIIGFSFQNLIRDWIAGFLVLWEDQYALGDVVTIENYTGIVEYLTLRVTKIRTLDGESISIGNNRVSSVKNHTSRWSRINLGINVDYSTDLKQAIDIIKKEANNLANDPVWSTVILEPPLVLGVDEFGQNYITIRLLIKTLPMRQWDVAREYRLRLKEIFEQEGIEFSFPLKSLQQSLNIRQDG